MKIEFKQIILVILIGIVCGLITTFVVHSQYELLIWFVLIALIGVLGKKFYPDKTFSKTFVFALLVGIVITSTHLTFVKDYLLNHQEETETLNKIRIFNSDRLTLFVIAPVYWIVLGILSGFTAKIIRR
jgi:uncharacterized membrane protein YeaQ/YmgE (transglycosylase-associated protein family)